MVKTEVTKNDLSFPTKVKWLRTALAFFLLASVFGTLMRLIYLKEIPFLDYKYLLHAHSHVAMLGWGFTAISGALLFFLISKTSYIQAYRRVLFFNIVAGIGMAIFFTYQGYGVISIAFSTIHLVAAYYFAWFFLKDLRELSNSITKTFARWSVYWMLISTFGLWSIAPVSVFLGKSHPLYFAGIQFFLHFQFNGWFTYAILALLTAYLAKNGKEIKVSKVTFGILQLSLILTYALSITWSTPEKFLFYLTSLGVVLQAVAFYPILKKFFKGYRQVLSGRNISIWLLTVGLVSLFLKIVTQIAVAIPFIAEISYSIRNFVIGFIHLTMLGSISLVLMAILIREGYFPVNQFSNLGYVLLIIAFLSTEMILFAQGFLFWIEAGFMSYYHEILFVTTLLFPIALTLIIAFKNNYKHDLSHKIPEVKQGYS